MLRRYDQRQPVSAYTWDENPRASAFATSLGMKPDSKDSQIIKAPIPKLFGEDTEPVSMMRWTAPRAKDIQERLEDTYGDVLGQVTVRPY
jgi:hypothetical protein